MTIKVADSEKVKEIKSIDKEISAVEAKIAAATKQFRNSIAALNEQRTNIGDIVEVSCKECEEEVFFEDVPIVVNSDAVFPEGWTVKACCDHCCHAFFCPSHQEEAKKHHVRCNKN